MIGRRASLHGRSPYITINGDGVFDAMFVNGDGVGLKADDARCSCATRQEVVICAGCALLCILYFERDKWRWLKKNISYRFVI